VYDAGTLFIQGQRMEPEEDVPKRYHLMEITLGPFERRIIINAEIDPEGITSTYTEGMLTIRIPKVKPREIEVREE
ncbi:MAG: Hsp20/alpha crystallin family protein, partial [Candidatus Hydrothermia bacterium]